MKYSVSVVRGFSSAHALRGYKGRCERLHGHNWKVKLTVSAGRLNKTGMVMDFVEMRALLDGALAALDHEYINNVPPFDRMNPTAENIARFVHDTVKSSLPKKVRVSAVEVWESDNSSAIFEG